MIKVSKILNIDLFFLSMTKVYANKEEALKECIFQMADELVNFLVRKEYDFFCC